ncbi:hypothetical protein B0H14DRAFT_3471601 [Mycena olivaceomarginata]|nr:hypothetical protein B0H14DRAFT_3471601 [Mycena olivaceomarginata]
MTLSAMLSAKTLGLLCQLVQPFTTLWHPTWISYSSYTQTVIAVLVSMVQLPAPSAALFAVVRPSACAWLVIVILEPRFFPMKIAMLGLISSILIAPPLSIFGTTLLSHINLLKEIFSIPPLLIEKLHYMVYKRALE